MKKLMFIVVLFSSAVSLAEGDPNIYGPGGVNLGPNGDLPPSRQESDLSALLEEEREKTRQLQEQVQQLQQQVQQLQQSQLQANPYQNQYQIDINYGYPPQQNFGWIGGFPFFGGGFSGVSPGHKLQDGGRGGHHMGGGPTRH